MFLGMGAVFTFLIIMIMAINLMSYIIHRFFPEPKAANIAVNTADAQQDKKKIVAVITAAIKHHREG